MSARNCTHDLTVSGNVQVVRNGSGRTSKRCLVCRRQKAVAARAEKPRVKVNPQIEDWPSFEKIEVPERFVVAARALVIAEGHSNLLAMLGLEVTA